MDIKKIEFFLYFFYFNVGKKLIFLLLNINKKGRGKMRVRNFCMIKIGLFIK